MRVSFGWILSLSIAAVVIAFFVPLWLGVIDIQASRLPSDWKIYENKNTGFRLNYPIRLAIRDGENSNPFTIGSYIILHSDHGTEDLCQTPCKQKRLKHGFINGVPYEYFDIRYPDRGFWEYRFRTFGGRVRLVMPKTEPTTAGRPDAISIGEYTGNQLAEPAFTLQEPIFHEIADSFRLAPRADAFP